LGAWYSDNIRHRPRNYMKKVLYLHAGWPKTGTTSLQNFCAVHRDTLLSKYGLYYPKSGKSKVPEHHMQTQLFLPTGDKFWRRLANEMAALPKCNILLSYEGIIVRSLLPLEEQNNWPERIRACFPDYEIRAILYLRRFDDWFKSLFNDGCKRAGHKQGWQELPIKLEDRYGSWQFDEKLLEQYKKMFLKKYLRIH